jgi:hypothetical protein
MPELIPTNVMRCHPESTFRDCVSKENDSTVISQSIKSSP